MIWICLAFWILSKVDSRRVRRLLCPLCFMQWPELDLRETEKCLCDPTKGQQIMSNGVYVSSSQVLCVYVCVNVKEVSVSVRLICWYGDRLCCFVKNYVSTLHLMQRLLHDSKKIFSRDCNNFVFSLHILLICFMI